MLENINAVWAIITMLILVVGAVVVMVSKSREMVNLEKLKAHDTRMLWAELETPVVVKKRTSVRKKNRKALPIYRGTYIWKDCTLWDTTRADCTPQHTKMN